MARITAVPPALTPARRYFSNPTNTVASSTDFRSDTTAFAGSFIRPAQRDTFHDDLIVGDPCVLAHHG